jgi:hypothetical protein
VARPPNCLRRFVLPRRAAFFLRNLAFTGKSSSASAWPRRKAELPAHVVVLAEPVGVVEGRIGKGGHKGDTWVFIRRRLNIAEESARRSRITNTERRMANSERFRPPRVAEQATFGRRLASERGADAGKTAETGEMNAQSDASVDYRRDRIYRAVDCPRARRERA